jgi:hypothetical protein
MKQVAVSHELSVLKKGKEVLKKTGKKKYKPGSFKTSVLTLFVHHKYEALKFLNLLLIYLGLSSENKNDRKVYRKKINDYCIDNPSILGERYIGCIKDFGKLLFVSRWFAINGPLKNYDNNKKNKYEKITVNQDGKIILTHDFKNIVSCYAEIYYEKKAKCVKLKNKQNIKNV